MKYLIYGFVAVLVLAFMRGALRQHRANHDIWLDLSRSHSISSAQIEVLEGIPYTVGLLRKGDNIHSVRVAITEEGMFLAGWSKRCVLIPWDSFEVLEVIPQPKGESTACVRIKTDGQNCSNYDVPWSPDLTDRVSKLAPRNIGAH